MTLYILRNAVGRYYVGVTANLEERLKQHSDPAINPSRWTKSRGPWILVFSQDFPNTRSARRAENFIKRMKSRSFIERLIAGERHISDVV